MQVGVYDRDDQMCQYEGCTEIDLLPARCSNCHKRFCSNHLAQSAHHCPAVMDVRVGTCPVCHRVVPLEYPRQNVNEAVSRHIDRGCRDVPQSSTSGGLGGLFGATGQKTSGRRLGGRPKPCGVSGCEEISETRVQCEQCGQVFCLQHRGPLQHHCTAAAARKAAAASPSKKTSGADLLSPLGPEAATVERLLTHPSNTPDTAVGKATELASDIVTCLVCFLIPTPTLRDRTDSAGDDDCEGFAPVASFFQYTPKNIALGRVLDAAVDRAIVGSPAVRTGKAWRMFAVTLPIHREAESSYYPALPLSTVVGKSAVAAAEHTVLFLTPLSTLPDCVVEAVKDLERKGTVWPRSSSSSSSGDACRLM